MHAKFLINPLLKTLHSTCASEDNIEVANANGEELMSTHVLMLC